MDFDDCETVGNVLNKCYFIQKIDLEEAEMNNGFHLIINRLKRSTKCLEFINLSSCKLNDYLPIYSLLTACSSLKEANLTKNHLDIPFDMQEKFPKVAQLDPASL